MGAHPVPAMSLSPPAAGLFAGAATIDITPPGSVFLFGYPHVRRYSTGVNDPLECAALYLHGEGGAAIFLAVDLIFFSTAFARDIRRRIAAAVDVAEAAILLSATHTHSGPVTADMLSNAADAAVPKADPVYLAWLGDRLVAAAFAAKAAAGPAELGLTEVQAAGVGTNRHDPTGPADPAVSVLIVRAQATGSPLACLLVYAMHPTVLHEDSTLISGDFPAFTRQALRRGPLPASCPVLYHNGASGDQSPRHVTRANTVAEAQRLGATLAATIAAALPRLRYRRDLAVSCRRRMIELAPRTFPPAPAAEDALAKARIRFQRLREAGAARTLVRTAECDMFGAEETAELARAAVDGRLAVAVRACQPAEIQLIQLGPWRFVAWPGEFFVEYALAVKARAPETFVVTLANGELQGYIVTPDAAHHGSYEALNAVFSPANGNRFVEATLALLHEPA